MLRFLGVVMVGLLVFLLYLMFSGKNIDYSGGYHCGWNKQIYIKCNGDEEIDNLLKEYK